MREREREEDYFAKGRSVMALFPGKGTFLVFSGRRSTFRSSYGTPGNQSWSGIETQEEAQREKRNGRDIRPARTNVTRSLVIREGGLGDER